MKCVIAGGKKMSKILFVTTRNICTEGSELRIIKNRGQVLKNEFGIETDLYGFVQERLLKDKNESMGFASENIISYKNNPIDKEKKYKEFEKKVISALNNINYSAVVISGIFPSNIAKKIRKNKKIYTVYDSHGALDKIKEFNRNPFKRIVYISLKLREKGILKYSDGAFVITESMKKYFGKRYNWEGEAFIVPPAIDSKEYSFEEAKALRKQWREKLSVEDDEVLFIYSGRIEVDEPIADAHATFTSYIKEGGKAKFLIMTPDVKKINYGDTMVMSCPQKLVSEVMFAGDIALMLRDNVVTSKVDFPNKYPEYLKSNMFIVSTPYISEVSKEINDTGTGIIIKNNSMFVGHLLKAKFSQKKQLWEDFEKRKELVKKYSLENTLISFVNKIESIK